MEVKKCCPNCKETRFSVNVYAYQDWDSEDDEWGEVEVNEVEEDHPYMCKNCNKEFNLEDLEEIEK